jgi:hypothetical protein
LIRVTITHSAAGADSSACIADKAPTPGTHVVYSLKGTAPDDEIFTSHTFHVKGAFTVVWSAQPVQTTKLMTTLLSASVAQVGKTYPVKTVAVWTPLAPDNGSTMVSPIDIACESGCYFKIGAVNTKYSLQVVQ